MQLRHHALDLSRPRIMAVLNVTPDSFSDGGQFCQRDAAIAHADQLIREGADILDVGGESTRPGAKPVATDEELNRTLPVIEAITARFEVPVSIDTSKPEVMTQAVLAGASLINDVNALRAPGALEAAANAVVEHGVGVCLMHMQGQPRTMQQAPEYSDVIGDIRDFFAQRIQACAGAGIDKQRLILDPGFGFGKTLAHNYELLARFDELLSLGCPLLAGMSRKSMLGTLLNKEVEDRLAGGISAHLAAVARGATIIRVHDVAAHYDALCVFNEINKYRTL